MAWRRVRRSAFLVVCWFCGAGFATDVVLVGEKEGARFGAN